jgi:hypothetical protein
LIPPAAQNGRDVGPEICRVHHLYSMQPRLQGGGKRNNNPGRADIVVVRHDLFIVDQDDRRLAAQALAVNHEVVAGQDRLVGHDVRASDLLRLEEIDQRMLEWQNEKIAGPHR